MWRRRLCKQFVKAFVVWVSLSKCSGALQVCEPTARASSKMRSDQFRQSILYPPSQLNGLGPRPLRGRASAVVAQWVEPQPSVRVTLDRIRATADQRVPRNRRGRPEDARESGRQGVIENAIGPIAAIHLVSAVEAQWRGPRPLCGWPSAVAAQWMAPPPPARVTLDRVRAMADQ